MLSKEDRLRMDLITGYRFYQDYHLKIVENTLTPKQKKYLKKMKRKERFMDFLSVLFLILGWTFCILAGSAMMCSWWGALFFIPALGCSVGLKELSKYI